MCRGGRNAPCQETASERAWFHQQGKRRRFVFLNESEQLARPPPLQHDEQHLSASVPPGSLPRGHPEAALPHGVGQPGWRLGNNLYRGVADRQHFLKLGADELSGGVSEGVENNPR